MYLIDTAHVCQAHQTQRLAANVIEMRRPVNVRRMAQQTRRRGAPARQAQAQRMVVVNMRFGLAGGVRQNGFAKHNGQIDPHFENQLREDQAAHIDTQHRSGQEAAGG